MYSDVMQIEQKLIDKAQSIKFDIRQLNIEKINTNYLHKKKEISLRIQFLENELLEIENYLINNLKSRFAIDNKIQRMKNEINEIEFLLSHKKLSKNEYINLFNKKLDLNIFISQNSCKNYSNNTYPNELKINNYESRFNPIENINSNYQYDRNINHMMDCQDNNYFQDNNLHSDFDYYSQKNTNYEENVQNFNNIKNDYFYNNDNNYNVENNNSNNSVPDYNAIESQPPKEIIKEVIKEVPIEIIKEVPIEIIKEVPIEIIKEVPIPSNAEFGNNYNFKNNCEIKEVIKEVVVPIEVIKQINVKNNQKDIDGIENFDFYKTINNEQNQDYQYYYDDSEKQAKYNNNYANSVNEQAYDYVDSENVMDETYDDSDFDIDGID